MNQILFVYIVHAHINSIVSFIPIWFLLDIIDDYY